jgi:hypothetical protein
MRGWQCTASKGNGFRLVRLWWTKGDVRWTYTLVSLTWTLMWTLVYMRWIFGYTLVALRWALVGLRQSLGG